MRKIHYPILFVFCIFLMALNVPQEMKWKGSIQDIDGISVVKNPKKPIYSEKIIVFEENLSIGKSEGPEEYIFTHILSFAADKDGNIFILDMRPFRVKVYDSEGNYLRSIGREGQGPGEFQIPGNIQITREIAGLGNR